MEQRKTLNTMGIVRNWENTKQYNRWKEKQYERREDEERRKRRNCCHSVTPTPTPKPTPTPTPTPCGCEEEIKALYVQMEEIQIKLEEWKQYTNYYTYPHIKKGN